MLCIRLSSFVIFTVTFAPAGTAIRSSENFVSLAVMETFPSPCPVDAWLVDDDFGEAVAATLGVEAGADGVRNSIVGDGAADEPPHAAAGTTIRMAMIRYGSTRCSNVDATVEAIPRR